MSKNVSAAVVILLICAIIATYIIPNLNRKIDSEATSQMIVAPDFDSIMQAQCKAWNEGSLDSFMNFYADSLMFMTSSKTLRSRNELSESYQKSFWSKDDKGVLSFSTDSSIKLDELGALYLVPGNWTVMMGDEKRGGKFSLIFKYSESEGWKIIADHTW